MKCFSEFYFNMSLGLSSLYKTTILNCLGLVLEDLWGSNVIVISWLFRQPRNKQKQGSVRLLPSRLQHLKAVESVRLNFLQRNAILSNVSNIVSNTPSRNPKTLMTIEKHWNEIIIGWFERRSSSCQYFFFFSNPLLVVIHHHQKQLRVPTVKLSLSISQWSISAGTRSEPSGIWTANISFGAFEKYIHTYLETYQATTRRPRRICWRWRPGLSRCPLGCCSEKCWRTWRGGWTAASLCHNDKHTDEH